MALQTMSAPTRRSATGWSSRARAPSRSSRRTFGAASGSPPGAKTAPAGIEATASADSAKVTPLIAKARLGGPSRSSSAPKPGPATMHTCWIAERAALAAGRSASSTSRGVVAATDGM